MRCSRCGSENPSDKKFCGDCGAALANICPKCGADNPADKRFCGDCGTALGTRATAGKAQHAATRATDPSAPENLEGERKTVTALFADIKGSTELEQDLDPEEARAIVDPALKLMIDAVQRYDGYVVQSTGDGIFAIFGAPVAHEDHPQRALYAALRMQDELRRYSDTLLADGRAPLEIRVGVNTGEVVVRSISTGGKTEYTPIGHTANLASRMQALAATGSIAITESTRRLVEGFFTLNSRGPTRIKGISEPVTVYEVGGVGSLRTRLEASRARGFSKFVGRDREMTVLEGALEAAVAGHGQVVGVVAEAGTGKSRLCFEFVEKCRAHGVRVNQGHCPAHGKTVPFLPLLEILRDIFGIAERDSDHEARRKIAGELLLLDDAFQQMLPILFDFMGVSDPARPSAAMSPEGRQQMLFAFVRHLTEARSKREPTVIFLDDLHWIDPGSDAFLTHAVGAVQNTRTLFLVNFRPEYRADWMRKPYYQQVALAPLGAEATREMLADLMGTDSSVGALSERIHHRTAGNPFFIEEVVQSMVESGRLSGTRGCYQLAGPIDAVEIPSTVQTVLAARIDRLGADEKRRLQTASVIGKEFTAAILGAVVAADEDRVPAAKPLESSMDILRDAEFIYETALYPQVEYAFKHPLTQEVAYHSQLSGRRAHLHAAVARTIERRDADKLDERAALIAYHWEQAGEALIAAKWYARAAEEAGVDSPADAMRHWERVRELLAPLERSDESDALRLRAAKQLLVHAFRQGMSIERAEEIFAEGRALAQSRGDLREQIALLYGVGLVHLDLGSIRSAIAYCEEGIALADPTGDPELRWVPRELLEYVLTVRGNLDRALRMNDEQVGFHSIDPKIGLALIGISTSSTFWHRGFILTELGRFQEANDAFRRCEELATRFSETEVLCWNEMRRTRLSEGTGDAPAAIAAARHYLELAEKVGSFLDRAIAYWEMGLCLGSDGDWEGARGNSELALEMARTNRVALFNEGEMLATLAEANLHLGNPGRARELIIEAIEVTSNRELRLGEIIARVTHARILCALDGASASAEIELELDRAADLVRATGAISYEPQIVVERARLAKIVGDLERSTALRNEAHRMFIAMGAQGRAERLAKELP